MEMWTAFGTCFRETKMERMTGFEPAILGLGSRCSTTEPHPLVERPCILLRLPTYL